MGRNLSSYVCAVLMGVFIWYFVVTGNSFAVFWIYWNRYLKLCDAFNPYSIAVSKHLPQTIKLSTLNAMKTSPEVTQVVRLKTRPDSKRQFLLDLNLLFSLTLEITMKFFVNPYVAIKHASVVNVSMNKVTHVHFNCTELQLYTNAWIKQQLNSYSAAEEGPLYLCSFERILTEESKFRIKIFAIVSKICIKFKAEP